MVFTDELPPVERSRLSKWTWRLFKFAMLLAVLFLIAIAILTRIGGNDDNLRVGLENLISRTFSDYPARVGTLHGIAFFPYIRVYAEDIAVYPPGVLLAVPEEKTENEEKAEEKTEEKAPLPPPVMTVKTLMFSRGFWDSFLWQNRIEGIRMEGINTSAGFILPRPVSNGLISLGTDLLDGKPGLEFSGKYGNHDFKLLFAVDHELVNLRPSYKMPAQSAFTAVLGPLNAHGVLEKGKGGGMAFNIESLTMKQAGDAARLLPLHGLFEVRHGFSARNFYLTVNNKDNQVRIAHESSESGKRNITATAERLRIDDIGGLLALASSMLDLYQPDAPGVDLEGPYHFGVEVKALYNGTADIGTLSLAGTVDDKDMLRTDKVAGAIAGGALSGTITLDAAPEKAQLALDVTLDEFDYSRLRAEKSPVNGTADAHVKLTGAGESFKDLRRDLDGDIVVLGGKGQMTGDAINIWGSGLLNTMLPGMSGGDPLAVNCLMMRFDVKNAVGTANPFLLDTANVTVTGEGTIDLYRERLDMLFTPEAKGVAIGTMDTAVRVQGPWRKPSVEPDALSLGKKLGELFLGTINPALWAWSLTDIGVSDQHPCRPYLQGKK